MWPRAHLRLSPSQSSRPSSPVANLRTVLVFQEPTNDSIFADIGRVAASNESLLRLREAIRAGVVPERPCGARGPLIQGYRQPSWISLLPKGGWRNVCVCNAQL